MLYEYVCPECGLSKEVEHSMKENPEILCDTCNKVMKRPIFGGSATHFKGQGWVSKGNAHGGKITKTTEVGVQVPTFMEGVVDEKNIVGKRKVGI